MNNIKLDEQLDGFRGDIEIIIKDCHGNIVSQSVQRNIIKIFGKEILSHRMSFSKVWDPTGGTGVGEWVNAPADPGEDFAPKYILFGASFNEDGEPISKDDDRYYIDDAATGTRVAKSPKVGADNMGGLINAIPLSEPLLPLKRIEKVAFSSSYQPSDSPLLQSDVRAINNVAIFETTLQLSEYNGFGTSGSNTFTITEVALAGGKELGTIGNCMCTPEVLFLEGVDGDNDTQIPVVANGGSTISINSSVANADVQRIKEGDQLLIVGVPDGSGEEYDTLDQVQPYYLVTQKADTGRDITLDRTPVDIDGNAISGAIGVYRSTLRIFSQRILTTPFIKSSDFEILVRWYIRFA